VNILAIETSCDETAAAVVADGRDVRSNVVSSQIDVHAVTGGVVPEVAARMQLETVMPVVGEAFRKAGVSWAEINALAVTAGPGLIGPLLVGVETAKALAYGRNLPLIPVNHLAGHLYACLAEEPEFAWPYLGLIVSGGHTELVLMRGHHDFELVGSTRDDAAGEAFDKVGRLLGFDYPAGPAISRLAESGNPKAIDFPRAMLDQDNSDMSFSGLKSAVRRFIEGHGGTTALAGTGTGAVDGTDTLAGADVPAGKLRADICASFQAAVVEALVTKTTRTAERLGVQTVLLGGGVAANTLLRRELADSLARASRRLLVTPLPYATDNAAMIGMAAYYKRDQATAGEAVFGVGADPAWKLAESDRRV